MGTERSKGRERGMKKDRKKERKRGRGQLGMHGKREGGGGGRGRKREKGRKEGGGRQVLQRQVAERTSWIPIRTE